MAQLPGDKIDLIKYFTSSDMIDASNSHDLRSDSLKPNKNVYIESTSLKNIKNRFILICILFLL